MTATMISPVLAAQAKLVEPASLVEDGAMTIPRAVDFSGIGRTTLYGLHAAGRLPFVKVGSRTLIPRAALKRVLAEGVEGSVLATA